MKTKLTATAYESPRTKVLSINPEGVLCASTRDFGWNGDIFEPNDEYSDWSN